MCHKISVHAYVAAGDPDRYPDAGEPWQPLKLYYNQTFSKARTTALHEAMLAEGLESPYGEWLQNWEDREERAISTRVPCSDYFEVRDRALLAHATQVDPDGPWFACPRELQAHAWPTEDFELARSVVDSTNPEDDLFAGVRELLGQEVRS
jgi:mycothiol S-conjugate amidase